VRARVESPDTLARGVAREGRARALSGGGGGAEEIRFQKRALFGAQRVRARVESPDTLALLDAARRLEHRGSQLEPVSLRALCSNRRRSWRDEGSCLPRARQLTAIKVKEPTVNDAVLGCLPAPREFQRLPGLPVGRSSHPARRRPDLRRAADTPGTS